MHWPNRADRRQGVPRLAASDSTKRLRLQLDRSHQAYLDVIVAEEILTILGSAARQLLHQMKIFG